MKRKAKGRELRLTCDLTGFAHGDILVGEPGSCGSVGGVMQAIFAENAASDASKEARDRYYAPNLARVDKVASGEHARALWSGLRSFSLFADVGKSPQEIMKQVGRRGTASQNIGWGLDGALKFRVIQPCLNMVEKLGAGVDEAMREPLTPEELAELMPRAIGSKKTAGQHVLCFQGHRWAVASFRPLGKVPEGARVVSMGRGDVWPLLPGLVVQVADKPGCARVSAVELLRDLNVAYSEAHVALVEASLEGLGAITLKSALQKLIRFRAACVELPCGTRVDSRVALVTVVACLHNSPGTFNPEIGKWLSGFESLAKRLAVISFEDSWRSEWDACARLLAAALLASRVSIWKPPRELVLECARVALELLQCDAAFEYNAGFKGDPFSPRSANSPIELCSVLLDALGSFQGDLRMVRHIASGGAKRISCADQPLVMPFPMHAVDQHVCSSIVFLVAPERVRAWSAGSSGGAPFKPFLQRLFGSVTGQNPRRAPVVLDEEIVRAQRRWVDLKQGNSEESPEGEAPMLVETCFEPEALDTDWLAGMVGPLPVRVEGKAYLVSLKPSDPQTLVAIPAPARSKQVSREMTQEDTQLVKAKAEARKLLRAGVKLRDTPVDAFKGLVVRLVGHEYELSSGQSWEEARVLPAVELETQAEPWEKLRALLRECDAATLRRVHYYVSTRGNVIQMNMVARDGGSLKDMVVLEDVEAHAALEGIALIFPSVLQRRMFSWRVLYPPLVWRVAQVVHEAVTAGARDIRNDVKWPEMHDSRNYEEWEHQRESTARLLEAYENGRNSFIYVPVGLGKSKIVMDLVAELRSRGRLPPYVIFCTPRSALASVSREIVAYGVTCEVLVPLKSVPKALTQVQWPAGCRVVKGKQPHAGVVTLLAHDYLRKCEDLRAWQSLVVVDEVHKTLRQSQRTGQALQLAMLSGYFVAMTGTPIVDSKATGLLKWLQQVSQFAVTERNLWTASNDMISWKVSTGCLVERLDVEAKMNTQEATLHRTHAPVPLGGINVDARQRDFEVMSRVALAACTRRMVELALAYVTQGSNQGGSQYVRHEGNLFRMSAQWVLHACTEGATLGDIVEFPYVVPDERKEDFRAGSPLGIEPVFGKERVMLVARDAAHAERLRTGLVAGGLDDARILMGASHLTDHSVESGATPDYDVAIVPLRDAEGYSLTRMGVQITTVIPSNQATREQMEGRINRLCQKRATVRYVMVHAGILSVILKNHIKAANMSAALAALAQQVDIE